ncbi:MAG: ATP-binding cassette domain-containing protein [Deltaproteobacteria bacterium]|nr:ATP-binding cassette domain-containing protein [Deltaproteobacteria bacterium]
MQESPPCQLSFQNLYRSFGRLAVLRGVSGEVSTGQTLLVTGANGSGKSTLLKCLAGLMVPDRGEISYRQDNTQLDARERRLAIGYVAPDLSFYEELTVEENLLFFARLRRTSEDRIGHLLERVNLPPDRSAGTLSSGMLQRLRWCFALLHQPRLLLLDEPFQNLDSPGQDATRSLLEQHLDEGLAVTANPGLLELPHVAHHLQLAG